MFCNLLERRGGTQPPRTCNLLTASNYISFCFLFDEVNDNGISHINKIHTTFAQLVRPLLALSKESIFALESELKQC